MFKNDKQHDGEQREQTGESSAPEMKEKVRAMGEQTKGKIQELSGKMEDLSAKIRSMKMPGVVDLLSGGKPAGEPHGVMHPSGIRGGGMHPSGIQGGGMHPSDADRRPSMIGSRGPAIRPEPEDRSTERMREDAENLKDKMPEVADRLARQMDEHIEGAPMRREDAKLGADDAQRLREQQLDVNRTSETDPANEMRTWRSAIREERER